MSAVGARVPARSLPCPTLRKQVRHGGRAESAQSASTSGRAPAHDARRDPNSRSTRCRVGAGLPSFTFDDSNAVLQLEFLDAQIAFLTSVCEAVHGRTAADQVAYLTRLPIVAETLAAQRDLGHALQSLQDESHAAVLATIAAGQAHVVTLKPHGDWRRQLRDLANDLAKVHTFYDSLGGVTGYQLKCLQLIRESYADDERDSTGAARDTVQFLVPQGPCLQGDSGSAVAQRAAADGLQALPFLAEIYPLGGAGDRLGLVCDETGEPLPAAMLPYCGRPMLDGLIRDLQGREYLAWRLTGVQHTTPVAIMTSDAKGNHSRVLEMLQGRCYYGRTSDSFRLFCQPLVPVLEAATGLWVLPEPMRPSFKPGGHGAIWKLMRDNGIFDWLQSLGREAALVRQISNPMASTDCTMLALAGTGHKGGRIFGFASCNRVVGAAEGMNVLVERRRDAHSVANGASAPEYEYGVTNIEYTEFQRLGIEDKAVAEGSADSCYPANTNILYVGLRAAAAAVERGVETGGGASLPGMIFNLKKQITYTSATTGEERQVQAGRMECTMQNIADELVQRFSAPLSSARTAELDTFVVYNERRRVTSSAKRAHVPGSEHVHQTPEGSFRDLMLNAADMLALCGVRAPEVGSVREYLAANCAPSFIWLWHPALGPLWQVVAQKVRGGSVARGGEVVLEVAELLWHDVHVDGSLRIQADNVVGSSSSGGSSNGALRFSDACARARLKHVTVVNSGVDYEAPGSCFWKHDVLRKGLCEIVLRGTSEFEAQDVTLTGNITFEVPDGHRMKVWADAAAPQGFSTSLQPLQHRPSWWWAYALQEDGAIDLTLHEEGVDGLQTAAPQEEVIETRL